jgi:hypothetical protein
MLAVISGQFSVLAEDERLRTTKILVQLLRWVTLRIPRQKETQKKYIKQQLNMGYFSIFSFIYFFVLVEIIRKITFIFCILYQEGWGGGRPITSGDNERYV